jgi:UDP-N-acetylmuramoyl-tripeptide--D-alanyl-D-alanine ligase
MADIVESTHGRLVRGGAQQIVHGVSTDSRNLQGGELFVALRGEHFDGHRFAAAALQQGAAAVLVADAAAVPPASIVPGAVILVEDTLVALQALARAHRHRFHGTVVAITGSNGKTTVKELTASVLRQRYATYKASGNLNNHIGLPLSLLDMELSHEVAVLEMGMNHLGEIRDLCAMAHPHIGVVTNVALAHVGEVGSLDAIQQAKGELIESLDTSSIAIVNADDPRTLALGQRARGRVLTFGRAPDATVRGHIAVDRGLQGLECVVELDGARWEVQLALPGAHQLLNALAAATVGVALQVPAAAIVEGLQAYHGMYGRMAIRQGQDGTVLIDDTYNANPDSMRAALHFLAQVPAAGRRLAVLGDMLELGEEAPALHREIGIVACQSGIAHVIALGPLAEHIAAGARDAGMAEEGLHCVTDRDEALAMVRRLQRPQDIILFKGSRGMALEHLVTALAADAGAT